MNLIRLKDNINATIKEIDVKNSANPHQLSMAFDDL